MRDEPTSRTSGRVMPANPIDRIAAEHKLQLQLCDSLEYIADGLPDSVDRRLVRQVIAILDHGLDAHFRAEETFLFPLLRERGAGDHSLVAALDQLEMEHLRDEDISSELVEELRVLADHGRARNPEMLGYMLRGFFEGQRRHIAWENGVVLPAARRMLSMDELRGLEAVQKESTAGLTALEKVRPA